MGNAGSPSGKGLSRRGRWRRWFVRGGLVALALAGLAYALRAAWLTPLVARALATYAREELGAEFTLVRVSGSGFGDLTLEGVTWRGTRGPLLGVREARVELEYSLVGLLRGAPGARVRVLGRGIELELAEAEADSSETKELPDLPQLELELSELVLRRPGREAVRLDSLRASGSLRARQARVERLELAAGANHVTLTDGALDLSGLLAGPLDTAAWLELVRAARGELALQLPDPRALAGLFDGALPLTRAELTLTAEAGRARLAGHVALEGGELTLERGELALPADGDPWALALDLGLQAEFDDLAPLGRLLEQPLAGRWRGAIDVQGPLRAPTGRFVGRGEALLLAGLALDALDVDVQVDGKSARFARCEAHGPTFEAVLRGELRLQPLELVDVALDLDAHSTVLAGVACASAAVHARLSGPPTAPRGTFEASATGVELGRFRLDDLEARGRVDGDALEVAELRLTSGESTFEAVGRVQRAGADFTAELERLALVWRGARVELERGARLAFGPGRFAVDGLELRSQQGDAAGRATITLRHADGTTRGALAFERYDAGPLLAPFLPAGLAAGRASGRVEGELGGAQQALAFELALEGWTLAPTWPELDGVLRGEFDGRALALERVEIGFASAETARVAGSARVPFDPARPLELGAGPVELRLEFTSADPLRSLERFGLTPGPDERVPGEPGPPRAGPGRLEADLAGEWRALTGTLALAAEDVVLGTETGAPACDLTATLELGEDVRVREAVLSAPSGSITLAGTIGAAPDLPHWLEDRWVLLDAPLELTTKLDLADLSWIAALSADVRRVSGQVAGRVAITGNALQPSFAGLLSMRGGELRLASLAFPLRNLAADLRLEGTTVRIESLVGEIGGAPVHVTGTLEPFGPYRRVDLAVEGQSLLLARDAHVLVRADAALVLKGSPSQLQIRGELALAEGRYRGEISPLEELLRVGKRSAPRSSRSFALFPDGPLSGAEFDLHLGGTHTFEYRTNLLEATLRPDLRLRGTGAFPVFEGPVYLEEASLILPSGKLRLESGLLTFRPEAGLQAELVFTAGVRVQRHDVRLSATGTLDELEVVLSSSPPLPSDDLWILLLTGQLPTERWQDRSSQAMEALAVFLARDSLVRWFGNDQDADSLLERFEIDVGARASQTGQPTGRVLFYLRPLTRRSGRATYLSAEIDEYDRVNYALGIVFRPR